MDCLFCKIASHEKEADVVYEDKEIIAFKDINPKASTHILVVPKKHIESLKEAEQEDRGLLGKLMLAAKKIAEQQQANSYKLAMNVGKAAGQQVEHLHLHLLIGEIKEMP